MRAVVREDLPCYALALVSALLLRLAFPRPGLWPVAWVALVPLLMALRARPGRRGCFVAWVFGASFSYLTVFWLNTLVRFNPFIPVGIVLLCGAMGVWVALAGWGWGLLRERYGALAGGLLGAAWWAATEWLRTLGPYCFPWGFLGTSQQPSVPIIQLLSLTGVYGLSFLIVLFNGFVADGVLAAMSAREFGKKKAAMAGGGGTQAVPEALAQAGRAAHGAAVRAWVCVAATLACVLGIAVWGGGRARALERETREAADETLTTLRVAVVQPNIMQEDKWDSYAHPDAARRLALQEYMILDLLERLDALVESGVAYDLVITPESAVTAPYFNLEMNQPLRDELGFRAESLGAPILLGADDIVLFTREGEPTTDVSLGVDPLTGMPWGENSFVAAWMLPADGRFDPAAVYRKIRLVPFGEWVPWLDKIPGFQERIVQVGSFTPGREPAVFPVAARAGGWQPDDDEPRLETEADRDDPTAAMLRRLEPPHVRVAPSICFESVFADLHGWMARRGADVLINITNDAWYGRSSGPAQHFQIAVLRAVETGRPLVRCANTGITAIVSPAGRVVERLPFYEPGTLTTTLPVALDFRHTPYTRWGDRWAVGCLVASALALLGVWVQARTRKRGETLDTPEPRRTP